MRRQNRVVDALQTRLNGATGPHAESTVLHDVPVLRLRVNGKR